MEVTCSAAELLKPTTEHPERITASNRQAVAGSKFLAIKSMRLSINGKSGIELIITFKLVKDPECLKIIIGLIN